MKRRTKSVLKEPSGFLYHEIENERRQQSKMKALLTITKITNITIFMYVINNKLCSLRIKLINVFMKLKSKTSIKY